MVAKDFKVHPAILNSVIKAQAGTPAKAFLELVMNSIDAGASQVSVQTDGRGFTVEDDGSGFIGKTEIDEFFGTFGTPHEDGDAVYGKFRMGRGQIFAFSRNTWRTSTFEMAVDIEGKGLCYILKEDLPPLTGCTISGEFYKPLDAYETDQLVKRLRDYIRYAQIPVFINGQQSNTLPQDETWDIETEFAYIKKKSSGPLSVYNLGVFVCDFHSWDYALCGTVVSKKRLDVNFARNDILRSKCEIWREISRHLKDNTTKKIVTKKILDEAEKTNLARRLMCGDLKYSELRTSPLFTDVSGRDYSMLKLVKEKKITVCREVGSLLADKVLQHRHAWVLKEETLERFGVETPLDLLNGLLAAIQKEVDEIQYSKLSQKLYSGKKAIREIIIVDNVEYFAKYFNEGYFLIDAEKLQQKLKCVLYALNAGEYVIRFAIGEVLGIKTKNYKPGLFRREIVAGESDLAEAWTDGATMVAMHKKILPRADRGAPGFLFLCAILVHEYLHNENDAGSHIHDAAFYAKFHNVITWRAGRDEYDLYTAAQRMAKIYFNQLKKHGLPIKKSMYQDQGLVK